MNDRRALDAASRRTMTGPPLREKDGRSGGVPETSVKQITRREMQLMFGLARGRTLAQIGQDLYVSTSTAKTHMHNLMGKTGCHTQSQLVSWGYRWGYMRGLNPEGRPALKFTPREMTMLQYCVMGLENPDIARRAIVSLDTVKTYMTRLRLKMKAKNRAHITAIAWQLGIVRLEWWEDLGVAQPRPLRLIMPVDENYTGRVIACSTCGGGTMPVPTPHKLDWIQDSIW